jgi:hypothetical protein
MYKKCLVPLDGSELAECALNHVKNLVKEKAVGEITILNVVKVDIPWADIKENTIDLAAIRKPLFAAARTYLADVESRLSSKGMKVKTKVIEGNRPAKPSSTTRRKTALGLSSSPPTGIPDSESSCWAVWQPASSMIRMCRCC